MDRDYNDGPGDSDVFPPGRVWIIDRRFSQLSTLSLAKITNRRSFFDFATSLQQMTGDFDIPSFGNFYDTFGEREKDKSSEREAYSDQDPFLVNWNGEDDPENPMNFTSRRMWMNIGLVSTIAFVASIASAICAPGVPQIMAEFKNSNRVVGSFVVSVFVLGYAIGPLMLAPLSELFGRLKLYHISNAGFFFASIACALAPNLESLIIFRFIAGCAGAAPLAIGGGTIADIVPVEKRGKAIALYTIGPLLGPVIGPLGGGFLTNALGWRSTFWCLAILGGFTNILCVLFLNETHAPTLLRQRASLKNEQEKGDPYVSALASKLPPSKLLMNALVRPFKLLFTSPIVFLLSAHLALTFGYVYLLLTTFTGVFGGQYHISTGNVGLTYLGLGFGFLIGVFGTAAFSDKILLSLTAQGDGKRKPEYRLPLMVWSSLLAPTGLFLYGWSAQLNLHFVIPIMCTALIGAGLLLIMMPLTTYLIDAFTLYAASAVAASTVMRCIFGAVLPLAGEPLYEALGLGWGNSLLGFIALAMAPAPFLISRYGEKLRKNYPVNF